MSNFKYFIDFSEYDEFNPITQNKSTKLVTSQKNISPSHKYLFKIFQFNCYSPNEQKIILDTFYQISRKKSQYLRSYNYLSFSYGSKLKPTFSMKYISSKTLEQVLRTPSLLTKLSIENIMQCLFAVAEGMSYLHNHLVYHGNLCPSNIIIDEANQFYLVDFGLYSIKKLYIKEEDMFNKIYKDPSMKNNQPTFINDVYSYGVLMCDIYLSYLQATNKLKQEETLQNFLKNTNKSKFDSFPSICVEIIPACLNSFASERPSFNKIVEIFKNTNQKIFGINIQKIYNDFINSNYIFNLALKNDPIALNKIGEMYEKGIKFEKNRQKALESFEKAANLNNSEGQNNYGVLLQENAGDNVSVLKKGARYLQLSAEQGNIHGMANYGIALLNGVGVEKNFQKAEEYLKKSAELGYSNAQVNYGYLLLNNNPTVIEVNKALGYIKKAMNQNNPGAFYTYAILLQKGFFVEKNDVLALENLKIAADMGYEKAIIEYADCNFKNGDVKVALKYYQLAFENGNTNVKEIIDSIKGKPEQIITPKNLTFSNQFISIDPEKSVKTKNESLISNEFNLRPRKNSKRAKRNSIESKKIDLIESENDSSSSEDYKDSYYYNRKLKKNGVGHKKKVKNFDHLKTQLPLRITSKIKLISLGEIVYNRLKYHSTSYIYPVGYTVEKEYFSIFDPNKQTIYRGSILDGGDSPIFRVECLDESKMIFDGNTPSKPWRDVLVALEKSRIEKGIPVNDTISISGPSAYAFSMNVVVNLIERLPNANRCIKYRFKKYVPHGVVSNKSNSSKDEEEENVDGDGDIEEEEEEEEDTNQRFNQNEFDQQLQSSSIQLSNDQKTSENEELIEPPKLVTLPEVVDLNQPVDDLINLGDAFYEQADLAKASECYKEVVKRGNLSALLKCAEAAQTFDEQMDYFELAIKEQIPMSFSKWRICIMKRAHIKNDQDTLLSLAKLFEKHGDFSDAAIVYNMAKDTLNSQICYHKALKNIEYITDGYQQYDLALFMINQKDQELAKIMLQKALENNVSKAESKIKKLFQPKQQKSLTEVESILEEGINFYEGKNGHPKDFDKAMQCFENASKLGCPKADFYIGNSFSNAYAIDHLRKSAEAGDPDGQNRYGFCLKNGISVNKDVAKAMFYFKQAADNGNVEAAFQYGHEKYENGSTEEEKKEGIEYLRKSAEKLFPDAIYMYSKIYKDINPEDSRKFFNFAIEKGSKLAMIDQVLNGF